MTPRDAAAPQPGLAAPSPRPPSVAPTATPATPTAPAPSPAPSSVPTAPTPLDPAKQTIEAAYIAAPASTRSLMMDAREIGMPFEFALTDPEQTRALAQKRRAQQAVANNPELARLQRAGATDQQVLAWNTQPPGTTPPAKPPLPPVSKKQEEEVGFFEGMSNGFVRGYDNLSAAFHGMTAEFAIDSLRADQERGENSVINTGGTYLQHLVTTLYTKDELKEIARNHYAAAGRDMAHAASLPMSTSATQVATAMDKAFVEGDYSGVFGAIVSNPVGFMSLIAEGTAESAIPVGTSILLGAVGSPAAGLVVMTSMTAIQERYAGSLEYLQQQGVDFSSPEAVNKLISDPKLMAEARRVGLTRGALAVAATLAVMPVSLIKPLRKMAQTGLEHALSNLVGVGQDMASQYVTTGEVSRISSAFMGVGQNVATAAASHAVGAARGEKNPEGPRDASPQPDTPAESPPPAPGGSDGAGTGRNDNPPVPQGPERTSNGDQRADQNGPLHDTDTPIPEQTGEQSGEHTAAPQQAEASATPPPNEQTPPSPTNIDHATESKGSNDNDAGHNDNQQPSPLAHDEQTALPADQGAADRTPGTQKEQNDNHPLWNLQKYIRTYQEVLSKAEILDQRELMLEQIDGLRTLKPEEVRPFLDNTTALMPDITMSPGLQQTLLKIDGLNHDLITRSPADASGTRVLSYADTLELLHGAMAGMTDKDRGRLISQLFPDKSKKGPVGGAEMIHGLPSPPRPRMLSNGPALPRLSVSRAAKMLQQFRTLYDHYAARHGTDHQQTLASIPQEKIDALLGPNKSLVISDDGLKLLQDISGASRLSDARISEWQQATANAHLDLSPGFTSVPLRDALDLFRSLPPDQAETVLNHTFRLNGHDAFSKPTLNPPPSYWPDPNTPRAPKEHFLPPLPRLQKILASITDPAWRARAEPLLQWGHSLHRHLVPPEALKDRVVTGKDPANDSMTDAITGNPVELAKVASGFNDIETLIMVEDSVHNHPQVTKGIAKSMEYFENLKKSPSYDEAVEHDAPDISFNIPIEDVSMGRDPDHLFTAYKATEDNGVRGAEQVSVRGALMSGTYKVRFVNGELTLFPISLYPSFPGQKQ
ncbi:hypothetical protein [Insolitispirillum peregrinum]|uniref:hypothetical protein n=1 Tax=Insolitispirillum peregrinum TaxID=80876 RepID=UPI0036D2E832